MKSSLQLLDRKLVGGGILALALMVTGPAYAVGIGNADSQVQRSNGTGSGEVNYTVVKDSDDSIKFEDASSGLGESGAMETDVFVIAIDDNGWTVVNVETKASTETAVSTLREEGDSYLDELGFSVTLVSIEDGSYTIAVTSEDVEHALSHITFTARDSRLESTFD